MGRLDRSLNGELSADLGPARELRVSWSRRPLGPAPLPDADAAELLWMQAQSHAVQVRARVTYSVPDGGLIERIDVEVDPRLRLLPPAPEHAWRLSETNDQGMRIVQCWLDEPADSQATVELAFALAGTPGNLVVPRLRTRASRRVPTWLGITPSPDVEARLVPGTQATSIPPSDFSTAWGDDIETPRSAYRLESPPEDILIALVPRQPSVTAEQEVDLTFSSGLARIAYEAQFNVENGAVLQQLLRVPPGFVVREVILIHDDITRLLRWCLVDERTLAVFSSVPLTGSFHLWVKGEVALTRAGTVELPIVGAAATRPQPSRVRLYRRANCQVRQIESTPGLVPDEHAAVQPFHPSQGRFLAAFTTPSERTVEPSVRVSLTANRPRLQGSMVTTLEARDDIWWVDIGLRLTARNGVVDAIRLRLPPEVDDALQITPPLPIDVVPVPGERSRQVIIRFPSAQDAELNVQLRGRLLSSTPESVRAPGIELLDTTSVARYVVLPRQAGPRSLSWNTRGLQERELPAPWKLDPVVAATSDVFQVMSDRMEAVVGPGDHQQGVPHVALADYRYRWFDADRRFEASASFDLRPAGASGVVLETPPTAQLVYVTVGGVLVAPQHVDERHWRIPLALRHLPQRVEALFFGRVAIPNGSSPIVSLPAPRLVDVPCDETLWTVVGPREWGAGDPVLRHTRQNGRYHATRRLAVANELREPEATKAPQDHMGEAVGWTGSWSDWVAQLTEEARLAEQSADGAAGEQLGIWGTRFDLAGRWSVPGGTGGPATYCAVRGDSPSLELRYDAPRRGWLFPSLAAVVLFGGVLAVHRLSRAEWFLTCCLRYPQLIVALLGVAWWLWFSPSLAGLVLLALAVAMTFRTGWVTRPVR
ncbi:MAG: hypothetical protein AB7F89_19405 [Pirellulaceae bacterium]